MNWRSLVALAILAALAHLPLKSQGIVNPYQDRSCERLGASSTYVNLSQIVDLRLPTLPSGKFSAVCSAQAGQKLRAWRSQDEANVEVLDNRLCSYRLGWEEYIPGTCQAGGPPPLCPREDHWHKVGPLKAMNDMGKQELPVRKQRMKELADAACDCKLAEIAAADHEGRQVYSAVPASPATRLPRPAPASGGMVASCNFSCPPGMSCVNGICTVPSEQTENRRRLTENLITESVVDNALEPMKKEAARRAFPDIAIALGLVKLLSETFVGKALETAYDVAKPTMLGTDESLYEHMAVVALRHLQELQRLDAETRAFHEHRPSRSPDAIQIDRKRVVEDLRADMKNLNVAYLGVSQSNELGPFECPRVLEWQQIHFNQAIVNVIAREQ